jgi:hypothetical protein
MDWQTDCRTKCKVRQISIETDRPIRLGIANTDLRIWNWRAPFPEWIRSAKTVLICWSEERERERVKIPDILSGIVEIASNLKKPFNQGPATKKRNLAPI